MNILVAAVEPRATEALGGAADPQYVVVGAPDAMTLARVARDLWTGAIIGAALLRGLDAERLWLSHAHPGFLVVDQPDEGLVEELARQGWDQVEAFEGRLVLVAPAISTSVRTVSAGEFAEHIEDDEPLATEVDPDSVDLADGGLFGVFASSRLGGSCALLSLSGDGLPHDSPLRLRNPAALGLERSDAHLATLGERNRAGSVRYAALGLTAGHDREEWPGFEDPDAIAELWASTRSAGAGFWLMLQLRAPTVDPPVWMPAGQIFEQRRRTGRQTLATTAAGGVLVAPGQLTTFVAPAYCLDRQLGPPTGDPMRVTPLRVPVTAGATQYAVWRERARARESDR